MFHKYFCMIFRQVPVHSSLLLGAAAMASQERKASRLTIRYGGDNGIMCYTFQLATRLNHNAWLTSLVQGTLTGQLKSMFNMCFMFYTFYTNTVAENWVSKQHFFDIDNCLNSIFWGVYYFCAISVFGIKNLGLSYIKTTTLLTKISNNL